MATKTVKKCGTVEGPMIERGWACCACRAAHGVAVYNIRERRTCRECGHKRCVGAMKRVWPEPMLAVPEDAIKVPAPPENVGGLFGILQTLLGGVGAGVSATRAVQVGHARRWHASLRAAAHAATRKPTEAPWEDPRWTKACDEVVAAFASAQVHEATQAVANGETKPAIDSIARHVKKDLPRAIQIFGHHPADARPCKCRHYSIVAAGAERTAERTGQDFRDLVKAGTRIVDRYLASRS